MRDGPANSTEARSRREEERARARERLRALIEEREHLDRRRQDITDEIHKFLRVAHDLGVSWSELAILAKYRNAAVAKSQAAGRDKHPLVHPPDTYSVREAAEHFGVTPQTIYSWIAAGRLQVTDDRSRGRRVLIPPDSSSDG